MCVIRRIARSPWPISISRRKIRISYRSHVAVPSPETERLVVRRSFFVGKGIGPRNSAPVLSAISEICLQISFNVPISVLVSFMRVVAIVTQNERNIASIHLHFTSSRRRYRHLQQPSSHCHGSRSAKASDCQRSSRLPAPE